MITVEWNIKYESFTFRIYIEMIYFVVILLLGAYLLGSSCVNGQRVPTTAVNPCHRRPFGFARDLDNCQQYFVCQNGNGIRARCPGQLAFDAANQLCWWREEVTCFQCPQTAIYSLQPVPHTCHQFYRCWRGRATIHTCPNDLVFHPRNRVCTRLAGSGCLGDDTIPDGCPANNGPNPVYLTHAYDCNAYFICENGRPREVRCGENLHFNPDLRVCDVPEKANCQAQSQVNEYNNRLINRSKWICGYDVDLFVNNQ